MVDRIVQTGIHHYACNIDGIDSCYGLGNCLFCDCMVYNSFHHGHSHLYHDNSHNNFIIAAMGGIKLSMVALVLASIIILLSPSLLLRTSIWFSTTVLAPVGSTTSVVTYIILVMVVIIYIFILYFLFRGKGRWLRLLLWFRFTFTFLSSSASCTFKWFRQTCRVLILGLCYLRIQAENYPSTLYNGQGNSWWVTLSDDVF